MQARRGPFVESSKPGNVDRRKALTDVMERLALGVIAVALTEPQRRYDDAEPQRRHDDPGVRASAPDPSTHRRPRKD